MKRLRNMMRCALELRRWDVRRLCFVNERMRYVCYYESFIGGKDAVRRLADGLHSATRSIALLHVCVAESALDECYRNGYTRDYNEYSTLKKTIHLYGRLCRDAWWAVRLVDMINIFTR